MKIRRRTREQDVRLPMAPMIDCVFLMLIFFIMTFKIVLPEGDFNIRMPSAAAARTVEPSETLPLTLVLKAGPSGELADLQIAGRSFGHGRDAFAQLNQYIRNLVSDAGGPGTAVEQEIELDCDYDLHYEYVMRAITAITGYIDSSGQEHKLIEKIKFSPPQKPPEES
jgi:biopolymer transport protein ExbD